MAIKDKELGSGKDVGLQEPDICRKKQEQVVCAIMVVNECRLVWVVNSNLWM